jgi:uncharacterized protein YkwD
MIAGMKIRILAAMIAALVLSLTVATSAAEASTPPPYRWQMIWAINSTRARYHLPAVHLARALGRTAEAHSMDMLHRGYFAHTTPGGTTLYTRIVRSGFIRYGSWSAGETLAWGSGRMGGVWPVLSMWMRSPEHRAVLLSRNFQWIGVGRAVGRFDGRSDVVMWTADWGHR